MKPTLVFGISASAEPLLEGRVRLDSGTPAVGAQVLLFDLADLRAAPLAATTDESGHFTLSLRALSAESAALPQQFALGANYPNPFNPSTIIPYQLSTTMHVRLEVFNILGQHIATLVDGERAGGFHTARWDATDAAGQAMAAGVYFYRLSGDGVHATRRMVLIDGQAGVPSAGGGGLGAVVASSEPAGVYGLVVSGGGFVPYVDPAFRVASGGGVVDVVVEMLDSIARAKALASGILGDVNNDGQVDASDALYISLYSRNPSVVLPNNGDISLGDVNGDGRVDGTDALLLIRYLADPSDPSLPTGIGEPVGATTTTASQMWKLYWADSGTSKIQRSNLDGSVVEDLVTTGLENPAGLALDVSGGKLYWTDWGTAKIQRSNLDGSVVEDLVTTGLENPGGIALDVSGGKLYWTDWGTDKIQRSNLDGSDVEDLVTSGLEAPTSIALGFVPVEAGPDLTVEASVSDNRPELGQPFTLKATVRNRGTEQATATTLRYYRSDDATISTRDTRVGTDAVGALAAADSSAEWIRLTAPESRGTYYYGACVESVSGESNTDNNCSSAGAVTVLPPGALVMAPGTAREYTKSFRANFSYNSLVESLIASIASEDIDDGLLGLSDVDVSIQYEPDPFSSWIRNVKEVTFSYNLRVSPTIPLNTTLRATIVYEIIKSHFSGGFVVATYTVSLVVFVNAGSSSAKVIAGDTESSKPVRVQESLSPSSALINQKRSLEQP